MDNYSTTDETDNVVLEVGMKLRAEATGRTYRITNVDDDAVHVTGLLPVNKHDIIRDIENGRITIVSKP